MLKSCKFSKKTTLLSHNLFSPNGHIVDYKQYNWTKDLIVISTSTKHTYAFNTNVLDKYTKHEISRVSESKYIM